MVFLDSSKPIKLENFKPVSNIKIIGDDVSLSALDENLLMYGLASSDLHSEQGIKGVSVLFHIRIESNNFSIILSLSRVIMS